MNYPPKLPSAEILETFRGEIAEIAREKIEEILDTMETLEDRRNKIYALVRKMKQEKRIDEFSEYFALTVAECEFAKHDEQKKWLRYWTDLDKQVSDREAYKNSTSEDIFDHDIQRAREFPIENIYPGKLRKSGPRLIGKCPFHEERTASFSIFPDNSFHCFGCGKNGDSIDFIRLLHNLTFPEAIKELK